MVFLHHAARAGCRSSCPQPQLLIRPHHHGLCRQPRGGDGEFTTGGHERGYYIGTVTLELWRGASATGSAPVVEIWDDHNHEPNQRIGTLITPDPIAISWRTNDNDRFTFTTLGNGIHVDPNTTYYVKVWDDSAAAELSYFVWAATEDQDQNDVAHVDGSVLSGWSIGNALLHRIYHRESWQTNSQGRMFRMGIDGNEASDEHAVLVAGSRSAGGVFGEPSPTASITE